MPTLSIILPSYNYAKYLGQALDSIFQQEYSDFEVILIDDASQDESSSIAKKYAEKHPNITFIQNEKNVGIFQSALIGMQKASGSYLHFFSADDLYLKGFLKKSMEALRSFPEAGLVCSDMAYFQDGSSEFDVKKLYHVRDKLSHFPPQDIVKVFSTSHFWIPGSSTIIKKELVEKHEGYQRKEFENLADWFLVHRVALLEGAIYIPETLFAMRLHANTYTRQVKKNKKRKYAVYDFLLNTLNQKENVLLKQKFRDSSLLNFIFEERFWKLLFNPRYLSFWRVVNQKKPLFKRLLNRHRKAPL